jgi:hypothetical protein
MQDFYLNVHYGFTKGMYGTDPQTLSISTKTLEFTEHPFMCSHNSTFFSWVELYEAEPIWLKKREAK